MALPTKPLASRPRKESDFGNTLREVRRAQKMTQQTLADTAGITRQTVRMLEQGAGSAGPLVKALAVLGYEIFPPPSNPRQHISTLQARVRKIEPTWSTPRFVIRAVLDALRTDRFCLDVASPDPPCVPCTGFYSELEDGLRQPWIGRTIWCNPPYSNVLAWTDKTIEEFNSGRAHKVLLLIPFAPATRAFRRIDASGAAMFSFNELLKFGGGDTKTPFPSALYAWGCTRAEIDALAAALGKARIWSYGCAEAVAA